MPIKAFRKNEPHCIFQRKRFSDGFREAINQPSAKHEARKKPWVERRSILKKRRPGPRMVRPDRLQDAPEKLTEHCEQVREPTHYVPPFPSDHPFDYGKMSNFERFPVATAARGDLVDLVV